MNQKLPFVLEIVWLIVMIGSASLAVYRTMQTNFSENILLYIIAILAALMYTSRRYLRRTREKNQSQK
ncbi:hypothetical protein [Marinifilum caeruleilacunae]|uniref:Uncharacterized protein n=1 Tax=Marinifilum caeruleilacunae TaxID=2499076 RepID=A0ABX1WVK7_9BACT|nr:hypothetical protein [Marinifilum caeruleilacunae]NOU60097.1 hypothetical protein [Marinifilum caeruleilacunae]